MSASWMLSTLLLTSLLALAAAQIELLLKLRRGAPLRWVWAIGMMAVLALSSRWLFVRPAPRSGAMSPTAAATAAPVASATREASQHARSAAGASVPELSNGTLQRLIAAYDALQLPRLSTTAEMAIRRTWLGLSVLLLSILAWSLMRLARERRTWADGRILTTDVLISDRFGPAVVGLVRPAIVVPQWVLQLEHAGQSTILAHEEEHRRASDPRLRAIGLIAVMLMPWNVAMWWMLRRLSRAIEFDCDARVVARGVRDAEYASVLLGAWQQAHDTSRLVPFAAFAERSSSLGRRVEHLMRPEPRRKTMKTISGTLAAATLVGVAMLTPAPQIAQEPAARSARPQAGKPPLILLDGIKRKDLEYAGLVMDDPKRVGDESVSLWQMVDSTNARRLYGDDGRYGASALWTKGYLAKGGAMLPASVVYNTASRPIARNTSVEDRVAAAVTMLTRGMKLTPSERTAITEIATKDMKAQMALIGAPFLVAWPKRLALLDERDRAIRQVLTDAANRAVFDEHIAEQAKGREPKSAADVADTEVRYSYYGQLDVSPSEIQRATKVVERSMRDEAALYEKSPTDTVGRAALLAKRDADVREVLDSELKRAAFDKRMVFIKASRARAR